MIRFESIDELTDSVGPVAVACGNFDGVHIGHQHLLADLISYCEAHQLTPAVFTFSPHPRKVINHEHSVRLLTALDHKISLLERYGIKHLVLHTFTLETAQTEPEDFVTNSLVNSGVKAIFVGKEWRFGKRGGGTIETLQRMSLSHSFCVKSVSEVFTREQKASSTTVRSCIASGNMGEAALLLGRNFTLLAEVVKGEGIACGKLGFPTANLQVDNEVIPPSGVYAGYIKVAAQIFKCIINVGYSPSFHDDQAPVKVEAHIFDYDENLYHREVELEFLDFIRPERKFDSISELIVEIDQNIAKVKQILSEKKTTLRD